MRAIWVCILLTTFARVEGSVFPIYDEGPRILAFADIEYGRLQLKVKSGTFTLTAYTPDSVFTMTYEEDDVHPLYTFRGDLRLNRAGCDSIVFTTKDTIEIRVLQGKNWTPIRPYLGKVTLRPNLIYLETIVQVPVEHYIAGVVEAEGGLCEEIEYHKAQAVLARTWLISNARKHVDEGYHIKDDQSSQAFKGIPHGKNAHIISQAVEQTKGLIATFEGAPIVGFYHSNSGGYTVQPEHVWSKKVGYCRTVYDPFSKNQSKYTWAKDLSLEAWHSYFFPDERDFNWSTFFAALPAERVSYYTINGKEFKLESVRREFGLRSSYFKPTLIGGKVHLEGKGFGHGVGMSQQGAMRMAKGGFDWKEILDFYFQHLAFESVNKF